MEQKKCPLCGSDYCIIQDAPAFGYYVQCKTYDVCFHISDDIYADYRDTPEFNKLMNLIVEKTLRKKTAPNKAPWTFYCDPNEKSSNTKPSYYNLAPLLSNYPTTFMERADRVLLNLSIAKPDYGQAVETVDIKHRWFFPTHKMPPAGTISKESVEMLRILADLGYLKKEPQYFVITSNGWMRAEKLRKQNVEVKQGFIAMKFDPKANSIRESLKKAIHDAGFSPMIMDEKEHNHQIVPEMLLEIERSRFLVLDVTFPSYGAYYEAGYALALGKEVIVCCDNKVASDPNSEKRPHFDVAQTSQIRWDTEEELVERLTKRIKATVAE